MVLERWPQGWKGWLLELIWGLKMGDRYEGKDLMVVKALSLF